MKTFQRFFSLLLLSLLLFQIVGSVSAVGYKNYVTESVSEEEKTDFLMRVEFFDLLEYAEQTQIIDCFALSEQGLVALAFNESEDAAINVYNLDGQFLYGCRFINNHSALAIFFEGEDLSVYWGKNDYIGSFDSEGNCIQFKRVVDSPQNSDAYLNDKYRPLSGNIGNIQYYAEHPFGFLPGYVRFAVEDSEGNRRVIYDVTKEHTFRIIVGSIFILVVLSLVAVISSYNKKKPDISENIML